MDDRKMTAEDFERLSKLASHANLSGPSGILAYASALDHFGFSEANRYFSMLIDSKSKDSNILRGYVKNEGIFEDSNSYIFRMIPCGETFIDCRLSIKNKLYCNVSQVNDDLRVSDASDGFLANSKLLFSLFRRLYLLRDIRHGSIDSCVLDLRDFFAADTVAVGTKLHFDDQDVLVSHNLQEDNSNISSVKLPKFERFNDDFAALPMAKYHDRSRLGSVVSVPWPDSCFFASLFGFGFKDAGAVFQYLSHPVNDDYLPNVNFLIEEFPCGDYDLSIGRVSDFQFTLLAVQNKEESFEEDFESFI